MEQNHAKLRTRIRVAAKQEPADLVIRNGRIVNVFTGEMLTGDIAISGGVIAGIGSYEGKETVDAQGRYIVPGFIDGHVHIESSLLTPPQFARVLLLHGVTTVITDPHEIANVAGTTGIQYMLDAAEGLPIDSYVMLPSCVPATPFESNGATLVAEQLAPFYNHSRVLGLAEVMDYPSVANTEKHMLDKLAATHKADALIDGHAAGISRDGLNVYMAAGIRTDHESVNLQEAQDRLDMGMYLMIREGTVAKDLDALLPVVTARNARRCLFVTDDKLIDELVNEGSIDHILRLAMAKGLDPITAIQMATLNAAECFRLHRHGAIAAGYQADLVLLDDLENVKIHQVYKRGRCVVDAGRIVEESFPPPNPTIDSLRDHLPGIRVHDIRSADLAIPLQADRCHIIEVIPNSLVTHHRIEQVEVNDGMFMPSVHDDLLKLAVVERHHATGNVGVGIVKGFGLQRGAIATTVAHDSHNIVVVGTSDEEMLAAIEEVIRTGGGAAVAAGREILASLPLPIAGLMSDRPYGEVCEGLEKLVNAMAEIGASRAYNPLLTLSFLTLPVIPHLKLTDKGLFDFASYSHISVEARNE
ncbi:adenine deaminase [Paenibacillus rhizovicinus]|uniref:Adenine deaminase n=1 Tax=Paenibacillus rhizovicinus TaxID=2704463 RepID=A0A6C0NZ63_9BACL|nr:adenine deaminase [Paenibacillus rhizovicinus]QHW29762.1 adenine deaminase [Paenibacillus rhizovicinus]